MVKILTLLFVVRSVTAFQVVPPKTAISTSALGYTIIGAPEEEMEQDPQSVGYTQQKSSVPQNSHNGAVQDLSTYRDYDEVLEDEDILNVDSFSHTSGAAIMPGFHLTALCGDD
mmetsp:Transcript_7503/g.9779  ORF Transcript_7503/g.9779 Transcript_7503/m.9779 type:complete len:114 (+) Transcript_7503:137-478(+)|eukprot:CAMPEP_0198149462 /NCGR_PEP_ID=MMETSP1443-20131203/46739_1 /TAXON_ID=186043 /ORGANISM="Entomoneis sp., Strain CCMP2396" /LENGTH=113 /DNA_ID=CAMNT_0043814515 /DNA_START=51 /DNA_END=392 /DNA_ORIENTATION=+